MNPEEQAQSLGGIKAEKKSARKRVMPKAPPLGCIDKEISLRVIEEPASFKLLVDKSNRYFSYFKSFIERGKQVGDYK